jgi:hypothetical protein
MARVFEFISGANSILDLSGEFLLCGTELSEMAGSLNFLWDFLHSSS